MRALLTATLTLLLLPAAAHAGGWASAGVLNQPATVEPGDTWPAQIEILQHGRTPLEGVTPAVVLMTPSKELRFTGKPVAGRPGVYEAKVVFPKEAGTYQFKIDDGFTNAVPHTFPPIEVADVRDLGTATGPDGGGFPYLPVGLTALAALAAAVLLTRRRRGALPA